MPEFTITDNQISGASSTGIDSSTTKKHVGGMVFFELGKALQGGAPPVIRWFINPMNTIVIGTINHSYWRYKPT